MAGRDGQKALRLRFNDNFLSKYRDVDGAQTKDGELFTEAERLSKCHPLVFSVPEGPGGSSSTTAWIPASPRVVMQEMLKGVCGPTCSYTFYFDIDRKWLSDEGWEVSVCLHLSRRSTTDGR